MVSTKKAFPRACWVAAAFLVSAPAMAAEVEKNPIYVGISAGDSKFKDSCDTSDTSSLPAGVVVADCEDSGVGFKVYGGAQLGPVFGVEAGFAKLLETDAKLEAPGDISIDVTLEHDYSIMAGFVVRAPLEWPIKPFAKLGAHYWKVTYGATGTGGANPGSVSEDDSGFDIMYGVGAQYDFSEESGFSIRAEWERFEFGISEEIGDEDKVDFISAGVVYRF